MILKEKNKLPQILKIIFSIVLFSTVISYAQNGINNKNNYKNSTNKNALEIDHGRQIPVSINKHNLKLTQNQYEYLNWLKGQNKKYYKAQLLSIHTEEKRYWQDDVEQEYLTDRVIVTIKHKHSKVNSKISLEDFKIDHDKIGLGTITDLTYIKNNPKNNPLINYSQFRQVLSIELKQSGKENVEAAVRELEKSPIVLGSHPRYVYKTVHNFTPSDSRFEKQWGLERIEAQSAWTLERKDSVKVGLMELGTAAHKDLPNSLPGNNTVAKGADLTDGTFVKGIIHGMSGPTEVSTVLLDMDSVSFTESLTYAADNGIKIINASFHYIGASYNYDYADAIRNFNILLVCSAGNDNLNTDLPINYQYPAAYSLFLDNVLSVGATTLDETNTERRAEPGDSGWSAGEGSNYGEYSVQIYGPETDILSTLPNNEYGFKSGTSASAAVLSSTFAVNMKA